MTKLLAQDLIRDIPDFPKEGILFKDITPILSHPLALRQVVEILASDAKERGAQAIVGVESRGFIFGVPVAMELGIPFIPVRKLGKLPYERITEEYALEYGSNTIEIHIDALHASQKVYIVDDLLATGGTALASAKLVERLEAKVVGFGFVVNLTFLPGLQNLRGYHVKSLIDY